MNLKIDPEFKNLIPPLTYEERELLEKNIVKEGCRDPIVVWDNTIIDGHNRYDICTSHNIEFKIAEIELFDRNEVTNWIIDNQLGKRNAPESVKDYLRGKRYTGEKKTEGGDRKSEQYKKISDGKDYQVISTAHKIANQYQVSEKTIRNDEKYSQSVDKIAENSNVVPMELLIKKISKDEANKLSTLEPDIQKEIVAKVITGETKTFKEALKPIIEAEKQEAIKTASIHDTDNCSCNIYYPTLKEVKLCPCGCGYGYCEVNEKWYTQVEMAQLDEE